MNKSILKSMPRKVLQLLLGTPSYQALWYTLMSNPNVSMKVQNVLQRSPVHEYASQD